MGISKLLLQVKHIKQCVQLLYQVRIWKHTTRDTVDAMGKERNVEECTYFCNNLQRQQLYEMAKLTSYYTIHITHGIYTR